MSMTTSHADSSAAPAEKRASKDVIWGLYVLTRAYRPQHLKRMAASGCPCTRMSTKSLKTRSSCD